ncbi:hypothetical protein IID10_14950 [candidate division KSB1 bacterium]|nr:hypothetical protein [candidate division KSB1 bacterium]
MDDRTFEVWYDDGKGNEEIEIHEEVSDDGQALDLFWELHDGDDPQPKVIRVVEIK